MFGLIGFYWILFLTLIYDRWSLSHLRNHIASSCYTLNFLLVGEGKGSSNIKSALCSLMLDKFGAVRESLSPHASGDASFL
jgi:hypothetical protein